LGGGQAKPQRQTTQSDVTSNLVRGVDVDDGYIFAGGAQTFYSSLEMGGNLVSGLTGDFLQKASDLQVVQKSLFELQAQIITDLFGPEEGCRATEEQEEVRKGTCC
jgi:hypothetical protein